MGLELPYVCIETVSIRMYSSVLQCGGFDPAWVIWYGNLLVSAACILVQDC